MKKKNKNKVKDNTIASTNIKMTTMTTRTNTAINIEEEVEQVAEEAEALAEETQEEEVITLEEEDGGDIEKTARRKSQG